MKPQIELNSYTRTKRKNVMKKLLALSLVIVAVTMFAGQTKQESHKEFVMDKVEKAIRNGKLVSHRKNIKS